MILVRPAPTPPWLLTTSQKVKAATTVARPLPSRQVPSWPWAACNVQPLPRLIPASKQWPIVVLSRLAEYAFLASGRHPVEDRAHQRACRGATSEGVQIRNQAGMKSPSRFSSALAWLSQMMAMVLLMLPFVNWKFPVHKMPRHWRFACPSRPSEITIRCGWTAVGTRIIMRPGEDSGLMTQSEYLIT